MNISAIRLISTKRNLAHLQPAGTADSAKGTNQQNDLQFATCRGTVLELAITVQQFE